MADIARGRWTHAHTGEVTVFLIGMRVNRWWRPDVWLPTAAAMGPMLAELSADRESGLLGFRTLLGWRGPTVIQYWRSPEDVYRYANDMDSRHRPAWRAFNRRIRSSPGVVGVWHETYQVANAESVYVDLPAMGLAAATTARPIARHLDRARARLVERERSDCTAARRGSSLDDRLLPIYRRPIEIARHDVSSHTSKGTR